MLTSPIVAETPRAAAAFPPMRPFQVVRDLRPLFYHRGALYCSRFNQIFSTADWGENLTPMARLVLPSRILGWMAALPLAQRALRAAVYRMRVLPDETMIFVFRSGVYRLAPGATEAQCMFAIRRGIRPVSLAVGPGGSVFFGEYWSNRHRDKVHIYGSWDSGRSWQVAYTFPTGDIRHVHGIYHDPWEGCFWVCTGDHGDECRLLRASLDFSCVEEEARQGQLTRFYSMHVGPSRLVMATDAPSTRNYTVVFNKASGKLEKRQAIDNSSFYQCEVNGRIFISTNAEPSPVNDSAASHVWMGDLSGDSWRRCMSFPVDFYTRLSRLPGVPKGLFQYPRIFFPEGHNDSTVLACQAIGLRGYDNAMLCYDTSGWSS